jgi:RNA polymerase sigma-B factor
MTASLAVSNPERLADLDEPQGREEHTQAMFGRLRDATDPHERERLCDEIVLLNMHVAQSIARRYRQRGAEFDDLVQVAHLGLVKAVERYDVDSGSHFLAFAVPTITGEVKRYFRDHCWAIRPTRRVQEVQHAIAASEPELTQVLGRAPTAGELAEDLGADVDHVTEALASDGYFNLVSLDMPTGWEDTSRSLSDEVGEDDWHLDWVENHELLAPALADLSDREKRLLFLRFEKGWKQTQIAADLGISQMQVSRLLSGLLQRLRDRLGEHAGDAVG